MSYLQTNADDCAAPIRHDNGEVYYGLTKREYFAGQIMSGVAMDDEMSLPKMAEWSVKAADALIAALNTPTAPGEHES